VTESDRAGNDSRWPTLPPWLEAPRDGLLAQRGRLPQALLITGAEGIGKHAFALHLAAAMLCESVLPDGKACGRCASCTLAMRDTHPDLRRAEPVTFDEDGVPTAQDAISVDMIRALIDWSQLSSHRGGAKVAVIAPADLLNPSAANALLKTLEEPSGRTAFVLVSARPDLLPPTVQSRCARVALPIPARDAAERWLDAQGVRDASRRLAEAGGAPLKALGLARSPTANLRLGQLDELARPDRLSPVGVGARIEQAGKDERRQALADVLHALSTWTADLAAVASGGGARFHADRAEALSALARRVARVPLFRYHRALLQQRALLRHPLQPRLVAESMLFGYRELFAREGGDPRR
jgi:DNA polymerase-3 subunit delta'